MGHATQIGIQMNDRRKDMPPRPSNRNRQEAPPENPPEENRRTRNRKHRL